MDEWEEVAAQRAAPRGIQMRSLPRLLDDHPEHQHVLTTHPAAFEGRSAGSLGVGAGGPSHLAALWLDDDELAAAGLANFQQHLQVAPADDQVAASSSGGAAAFMMAPTSPRAARTAGHLTGLFLQPAPPPLQGPSGGRAALTARRSVTYSGTYRRAHTSDALVVLDGGGGGGEVADPAAGTAPRGGARSNQRMAALCSSRPIHRMGRSRTEHLPSAEHLSSVATDDTLMRSYGAESEDVLPAAFMNVAQQQHHHHAIHSQDLSGNLFAVAAAAAAGTTSAGPTSSSHPHPPNSASAASSASQLSIILPRISLRGGAGGNPRGMTPAQIMEQDEREGIQRRWRTNNGVAPGPPPVSSNRRGSMEIPATHAGLAAALRRRSVLELASTPGGLPGAAAVRSTGELGGGEHAPPIRGSSSVMEGGVPPAAVVPGAGGAAGKVGGVMASRRRASVAAVDQAFPLASLTSVPSATTASGPLLGAVSAATAPAGPQSLFRQPSGLIVGGGGGGRMTGNSSEQVMLPARESLGGTTDLGLAAGHPHGAAAVDQHPKWASSGRFSSLGAFGSGKGLLGFGGDAAVSTVQTETLVGTIKIVPRRSNAQYSTSGAAVAPAPAGPLAAAIAAARQRQPTSSPGYA